MVSLTYMCIKMPFKITKRVVFLPFKLFSEFADVFIIGALNKVNHDKESASKSVGRLARKSGSRLKYLCIFMTVLIILFSVSIGFSASLFVGIYYYSIPADLT
jgi:hypothetical protein